MVNAGLVLLTNKNAGQQAWSFFFLVRTKLFGGNAIDYQ